MSRPARPIKDRLMEKIRVDAVSGCWVWTAATSANGYGVIAAGGKFGGRLLAHRVSWQVHRGEIPKGMFVCHHCDNPPCCNPAHLFVGTNADNMRDLVVKGLTSKHPRPSGDEHYKRQRKLAEKGL